MFIRKQNSSQTPTPVVESDGIEIRVKLSEATLIKLIPLIVAILVGSGALVSTQLIPLPNSSSTQEQAKD